MTEDEMVGWHHWLNGHESEQTLGDGEAQGSLECCSPWGRKERTRLSNRTTTKAKPWVHSRFSTSCTVSIHPWSKSYRTSLKNVSWPCPSPPPPAQARTPSSLTDLSTFNFFSSFNSILSPHSRKVNYNVNLINTTQNITQKLDHVIPPLKTP